MRILLIEDNEAVRLPIAMLLRQAGYDVREAADGAAGMRLWREDGADLVLTDIQMPEMNGIEVLLQLRAFAPMLPVIAMSGGERSRDLDLLGDAKLLGAVRLLQKPFSEDELLATVHAALTDPPAQERPQAG